VNPDQFDHAPYRVDARSVVGNGEILISPLGVGTSALRTRADALGVVSTAIESGINYFDTAPLYGMGKCEELLGYALDQLGRPTDVVISTKVGRTLLDDRSSWRFDFGGDAVRAGLEQSMDRLGVDHVDIAYIHDPDLYENQVRKDAWPALQALKDQGVVRAIGFGMKTWPMMSRFVDQLEVDVVLLAGRYTLLDVSGAETLLPQCMERGVSVVLAGVYNSGILANPVPGAEFDYQPAAPDTLARAEEIRDAAARWGFGIDHLALRFTSDAQNVASTLVGVASQAELLASLNSFQNPIPPEVWRDLRQRGLLPSGTSTK
jgi:D-threo-aldose 1-dehydrogenase